MLCVFDGGHAVAHRVNACETQREESVSHKKTLWEQKCKNGACDSSLCLNMEEWSHVWAGEIVAQLTKEQTQ